jgi:hypothetical protein
MTLRRHIGFLIVVAVSFLLLAECEHDSKCCSCLEAEGKSDKYDYPIVPGTPEWLNLQSGEEMYEACQIPADVLAEMCAVGSVDSWLSYPLRSNIFTWPHPKLGLDRITENFNGLNKLLNTPSTSEVLFKKYPGLDPSGYDANATGVEKGRYAVDLFILELTLSQFQIIDNLSEAQLIALVKEALRKRLLKLADPVYLGATDKNALYHSSDVYIMAHCMIHGNYAPFMLELSTDNIALSNFVETCEYIYPAGSTTPEADLVMIVNHAKDFVSD